MLTFEGQGINDVYPDAYDTVMRQGNRIPSRNGDTLELNPGVINLDNPRRRLVTSYGRPVNVAFALAEVLWILQGRRDADMLKFYNSKITDWSDDGLGFNAPYGYRLRETHGTDQIEDVIRTLQNDPGSRQAVLSVWHVPSDRGWDEMHPGADIGAEPTFVPHVTKDRACNVLCMMKIRDDKLNWTQIVRSNDLIWGVPYNVMQWTHVMEYIAQRVGVEMGHYFHLADSLHVYDFNNPADGVRYFDLYETLGVDHYPMFVGERVEQMVRGMEAEIRAGHKWIDTINGNAQTIGHYWTGVLNVLYAHAFYRDKNDGECIRVLRNMYDPVYCLTQARFYWKNRWSRWPAEKQDWMVQELDYMCDAAGKDAETIADLKEWIYS